MELRVGDRVRIGKRRGTVIFVRQAPPTYTEACAVSVFMDDQAMREQYAGTTWDVADVTKLEEGEV